MKSAIIKDGNVVNVIVGKIDDSIECDDSVKIGDEYKDGKFISVEIPVETKEPTYIESRKLAYGSWETQLEMINEEGIDAWKVFIADIKSQFPKPEGE